MSTKLMLGDCLKRMKDLRNSSVDSIVCDPPYGLAFMGKKWDYDVPSVEVWQECLRVLKPGGHLLAFAGTRTQHRMAVRIEDAGFEIRDMIAWVYGSGFPKSLDVSKAIDKAAGAEREVVRTPMSKHSTAGKGLSNELDERPWMTAAREKGYHEHAGPIPATDAAKQWQGWGTALKPALEPITVARKPLIGTVAETVLQHGTGAININACRVEHVTVDGGNLALNPHLRTHINGGNGGSVIAHEEHRRIVLPHAAGRWPANLIHDGSDEVTGLFPDAGGGYGVRGGRAGATVGDFGMAATMETVGFGDTGSAARFFYCAKASKKDRGEGNTHPTVKPTALMQYLCRLVTPPSGIVLDPFMGSGSTGVAAIRERFNFIGIEMLREHFETAKRRIVAEKERSK